MEENNEKETEEETEQSGKAEEEIEQCEESPLQNPLQEDEMVQILANMGKYAQPLSLLGLHSEEEPKEHFAQDKNTPEELCNEEEERVTKVTHRLDVVIR